MLTVVDLENSAEGLLLRNVRGSRGKGYFRGPPFQPVENGYHIEFRERGEAGKFVIGQKT